MLLRSTAKSWRGATAKAKVAPDRTSKSYRAGRAIGQLARGQKPTKYKQPTGENQVKGKKNVANIAAYRDGLRFDYAYDADSGDLYDVRYGMQYDPVNKRHIGLDGGIRVTNLMNVKEYRPTDFGDKHARPGMVPGRGTKGRKYTGVDAVVKALRDEGGDVYVLDKSPGKQKKASTAGGMVNWRSPIQATGEYIDPRKRHEIPTGPGDGAGTGYQGNPAKDAHNMYWRRTLGMSEQEKLAAGVLARGTAQETLRKAYGQGWRGQGPSGPPPAGGPSPQGPSTPGPQSGPPTGPSAGTGFSGGYDAWLKRQGIDPGNMGANWRPKPSGPPGQPPGHTPGPPPSQNQASPPQASRYVAWHSPHDVKPAAGQTRSGAASAGLGDAFSTDSHEYAAQYGTPVRYSFNMKNPYNMPQSEWRELDRGIQASFENSRKFRQKLEGQGHDGIIVTHGDGTKEYITFDRTNSAFQPFEEDPSVAPPQPGTPQQTQKPSGNHSEPPVPDGFVRLYHGSATHGRYDGDAWFSSNREYARKYRGEDAELQYVDVPKDWANSQLDPDGYGQGIDQGFTLNIEIKGDQFGKRNSLGIGGTGRMPTATSPQQAPVASPPGTGIVPVNPQPFRYAEPTQQAPQADPQKSWRNPQEGDQRGEYVYSGGQWVHNPAPVQQGRPFSFNMEGAKYKPEEVQAHRYADQFVAQHATAPDIDPNFDVDQFFRDLEAPGQDLADRNLSMPQTGRFGQFAPVSAPGSPWKSDQPGFDPFDDMEGDVFRDAFRPGPDPAPQAAAPQRQWRPSRKPNVAVAAPTPDPTLAAIYEAENRLAGNFQQYEMEQMAKSGRNKPYPMHPEVARDIELAHQGNYFGTNPAFESEELVTPEGFQVQPQTISLLAKTLSDTERARRGKIDTRKIENPFEYRTNVGPDTMPFGTEGDMRIEGYRKIGGNLLNAIDAEQATNPSRLTPGEYDRARAQVLTDFGYPFMQEFDPDRPGFGPLAHLERQKGLIQAAKQAEAEGDLELARQLQGSAEEIAFESFRRSPKMLDAFSTIREDTGGLTRGSFLSAPQQDESRINVMDRPDFARFIPEFAESEPQRANFKTKKDYDKAVKKWTADASRVGRSGIADFDARRQAIEDKITMNQPLTEDEQQFHRFARQVDLNEANLAFSRATGQGGSNTADTKMFNTVALSSPVPWADDKKELFSQIPSSLLEETALDTQFSRELANPKLGNSKYDYEFQPERFGPPQSGSVADDIASSIAGRLASVSRYGASLGFASNSVEAAKNRDVLQGQDGDEGFAPQGTSTHWSSLGTVEQQLEAIQGGGKVPGMADVHDATYANTLDEYRAKAESFLASLPPDMPKDQFDAAVNEFMRGEFNARVQSDYARLRDPESDLTGGHNIFRMPNTKSMTQDDPTKATLQQVFDGAIPEIVTPQSGDPFDAWNQRLQTEYPDVAGSFGPEADINVANAYRMVDEGIREKAQSFYTDAGGRLSPEVELAAQRFLNVPERPEDRIRPPAGPAIDMSKDLEGPPVAAPAPVREGLRRTGRKAAQRVPYPDQVRNEMNLSEKMIDAARQTTEKQLTRQDKYLFGEPGQNTQRIEADQFAIGDVVNLHVPTKNGGKLERAEVVDAGNGQVILEDGPKLGNIILDTDDPTRSAINVHSIEPHSDPRVQAERNLAAILAGKDPVAAPQAAPAPAMEAQPAARVQDPESIDIGKKKTNRGSKNPGIEYGALERLTGTPIEQILSGEIPKILTPKEAAKKAKAKGLKYASGYDNTASFSQFWSSKIFSKDGLDPDEVHGHLVSKGLMPEDSTPDDMFEAFYKGIGQYENELQNYRGEKAAAQQQERVQKEVFSPKSSKRNPVAIQGRDLAMGQQIEIAVPNARGRKDQTEIAEVVGFDEDGNALLEDGPRYGPFTVGENDTIYGKRIIEGNVQPGDDPWNSPEAFDMRETAAPNAFSLTSETPDLNYNTNQGLLLDVDPNEIERMLIEEQRRKNRQRLSGQSDFFGDVPF